MYVLPNDFSKFLLKLSHLENYASKWFSLTSLLPSCFLRITKRAGKRCFHIKHIILSPFSFISLSTCIRDIIWINTSPLPWRTLSKRVRNKGKLFPWGFIIWCRVWYNIHVINRTEHLTVWKNQRNHWATNLHKLKVK